jgi:hypothetical protein
MSSRRRIDWIAAKASFVGDPTRSFGKVARRFGVSDTAVRKRAKADTWEADAQKFDREAEHRALKAQVKTRDEHITQATLLRDVTFENAHRKAIEGTLDVKLSDLATFGKYVELLTGEATDRVELGEVREFVSVLFVRVSQLIEPAKRPAYLQLIHELEGQLPRGGGET